VSVTPIRGLCLLDLRQVMQRTGLSKSSIYRMEAAGTFPQHIKLTLQRSAWAEHEIDAYIRRLLESRPLPSTQQSV
jgi:prophage regulatory protein